MVQHGFPCLLAEKLLAAQTGQAVVPELVHYHCCFPQFNDILNAPHNNLRLIWFGHKIHGSAGQGPDLALLVSALGCDNNRNGRKLGIGLHQGQECVSIHHRHNQIKENQ